MMLLVSGATATIREHADDPNMGHLLTPGNGNTDSVWSTGLPVGGDNECFNKLNKPAFVAMLKAMRGRGVLWVACPDVVGDARATTTTGCLSRLWRKMGKKAYPCRGIVSRVSSSADQPSGS